MENYLLYNLRVPSKIIINVRLNNICKRYKISQLIKISGWWNNTLKSKTITRDGARVLGQVRWLSRERRKVKINKTLVNWAPVLSWSTIQNLSPQLQLPLQKITVNLKYKTINLLVKRGEINKILVSYTLTLFISSNFNLLCSYLVNRTVNFKYSKYFIIIMTVKKFLNI